MLVLLLDRFATAQLSSGNNPRFDRQCYAGKQEGLAYHRIEIISVNLIFEHRYYNRMVRNCAI